MSTLTPEQMLGADPLPAKPTRPTLAVEAGLADVELCAYILSALPSGALYRFHDAYITIEPDGSPLEMDPKTFVTWVARFIYFYKRDGRRKKEEEAAMLQKGATLRDIYGPQRQISANTAANIMAAREFRAAVPVLDRIVSTRLPVRKTDGNRVFYVPAKVGYDPDTQVYTVDSISIDWGRILPKDHCFHRIVKLFAEFPFDGGRSPRESHSFAATVTAMLGTLLHGTMSKFPLVMVNAGQPSTGKSFLVQCILAPVHGLANATNPSRDENEFRKTLNAALFCGDDYCWLDDIESLKSTHLNRFITQPWIRDRIMGEGKMFKMPNRMQFFATGNEVETSVDLEPRTLYIDLFTAEDASKRHFKGVLNEQVILSEDWRREMLSLLWSLVCGYVNDGCPDTDATPSLRFPDYNICARIARWAGFGDAFGARQINLDTGDRVQQALLDLITNMADAVGHEKLTRENDTLQPAYPGEPHTGLEWTWSTTEIVTWAESYQRIIDLILTGRQQQNAAQCLGLKLRKLRGRKFTDSYGRQFLFGDRDKSARSLYNIKLLSEPVTDSPRGY